MYRIWLLCILMQKFVLSEINNPCNVSSTVSTTPPPTSDQETNQILTQLQSQRSDLLKLQITLDNVKNQTCSEDLFLKIEKTIEDKINNTCNVPSTVPTTPPPTSNKETNQILTQLQDQHSDLLKLQITLDDVKNQTRSEDLFLKIEKTIEDKINNTCNVLSAVSTTPPPTSDQETKLNQILTQLQDQRNDLLKLQITLDNVKNQTRSEDLFLKIEKTIEDKIASQNKYLEQVVKSEVKKVALELEEIHVLFKKVNVEMSQKIVRYPEDCKEVRGRPTGVYKIQPKLSAEPFKVLCDMDTRGGGWVYVINRFDGIQDFYLNWTDYKNGFGKLTGDFWLGLDHLYELTNSKKTELLIELEDWDGKSVYALYKNFAVGNEHEDFKIRDLSGFTGNTTDDMTYHSGFKFITPDRDGNNKNVVKFHGPWWYHGSFKVKLTGIRFERKHGTHGTGIHWGSFHGYDYSLKKAKMLIRPF